MPAVDLDTDPMLAPQGKRNDAERTCLEAKCMPGQLPPGYQRFEDCWNYRLLRFPNQNNNFTEGALAGLGNGGGVVGQIVMNSVCEMLQVITLPRPRCLSGRL